MMRLLKHLLEIIVLALILVAMIKLPFYQVECLPLILFVLIALLFVIYVFFLLKKRPKLKKKLLVAGGIVLFAGMAVQAESADVSQFCTWAEEYDRQAFEAAQNNGQGDKPCETDKRETVRVALDQLKTSPSTFIKKDKLTSAELKSWRSFRQDSHWPAWVAQYFSDSGMNAELMACGAMFSSFCSEYERRHPDPNAKTVWQIMQENARTSGCWPCKMAYITLTAVQSMSADMEDNMREAGINILKIFMLLWILYATFLAVVFPSKAKTFLKDLITKVLYVLIAALILSSGDNLNTLYRSFLSPVVGVGLGLSEEIADSLEKSMPAFASSFGEQFTTGWESTDYCNVATGSSSGTENNPFTGLMNKALPNLGTAYPKLKNSSDSLITPELQVNLLCLVQKVYRQVSPMTAVGQSLMGFGQADGWTLAGFRLPSKPKMFFVGLSLVVLFSIFSFLVAFKIIDIFLRLGFVLVLIPVFVATWAFPVTRSFTQKGFMFLMGIITEFLGLVLALNFIMVAFESSIASDRDKLTAAMMAPYSSKYGDNLLNVVLSNGGFFFLFMLFATAFMGFLMLSMCTKMVGSFFGTSDAAGLGGDIAGASAVAAVKTGGKLWKGASGISQKMKPYQVDGKSNSYWLGNAAGKMQAKQSENKPENQDNKQDTPAAPKRFFDKVKGVGNGIDRGSQFLAAGIDGVGVKAGQALSKSGVGALVGVPLALGAKSLSLGVRATGKLASGIVKAPGAVVHGVKNIKQTGQNIKRGIKAGGQVVWNKVTSGPRNVANAFKKGMEDGKK